MNKIEQKELRELITVEARKLLNAPFCHNGNGKYGIDCLGLCWRAYKEAGFINFPRTDGQSYKLDWWRHTQKERLIDKLMDVGFEFTDNPQKGDLIVFRLFKNNPMQHCGIYINELEFIHAKCGFVNNMNKVKRDSFRSSDLIRKKREHKFMVYKELK